MPAPVLRGRAKLDTGFRRSPADIRDVRYGNVANPTLEAPEEFSFETGKFKLPIYNQGDIPKCVASSLSLLKTAQERVECGKSMLFNDDELYGHIDLPGGGAYIRDGLQLLKDRGALPISNAAKPRPRSISLYAGVDPKNHTEVKHAMMQAGVLVIGMSVTRGFAKGGGKEFDAAAEGNVNEVVGAHAIAATAYDPEGPTLHNSWGDDWMDAGKTKVTWEFWDRYVFECWTSVDTRDDAVKERLEERSFLNLFA